MRAKRGRLDRCKERGGKETEGNKSTVRKKG